MVMVCLLLLLTRLQNRQQNLQLRYAAPQFAEKQEAVQPETHESGAEQAPAATPSDTESAQAPVVELKTLAPATEVRDVRIEEEQNHVDVVLVGDGSFTYDDF